MNNPVGSQIVKWEYLVERMFGDEHDMSRFDDLGYGGWELVGFVGVYAYFKRPLPVGP